LFSTGVLFFYFKEKKPKNLKEKIYSPIQYINQFKGLFFFNSYLSLSLIITLFSFVGVPPLIGFFGKQMILSAALDKNYNFLTLVAILTSVISAVYYLVVIKQIIFEKPNFNSTLNINIKLASTITIFISIISLIILLYILMPKEYLNMTNILSQIVFNF
jgi:NADH-ubiquinone oxidoreductase chain 2